MGCAEHSAALKLIAFERSIGRIAGKRKLMTTNVHQRQAGRGSRWQDYMPLMVIVGLTLLSACAKEFAYGERNWMHWMHDFMGFFLVIFSMFKFLDMEGFADGFQMYD